MLRKDVEIATSNLGHIHTFNMEDFKNFYSKPDTLDYLKTVMKNIVSIAKIEGLTTDAIQLPQTRLRNYNVAYMHKNTAIILWEPHQHTNLCESPCNNNVGHFMLLHKGNSDNANLYDSFGRNEPNLPQNINNVNLGMCYQDIISASCGAWAIYFFITRVLGVCRPSNHIRPISYNGDPDTLFKLMKAKQLAKNEKALYEFYKRNIVFLNVHKGGVDPLNKDYY